MINIKYLDCSYCKIENQFDTLSPNLIELISNNNYIRHINNLPSTIINCSLNKIENLINLPRDVVKLSCCSNKIKSLYINPQLVHLIVDKNVFLQGIKKNCNITRV
jgi:hypothetical protein